MSEHAEKLPSPSFAKENTPQLNHSRRSNSDGKSEQSFGTADIQQFQTSNVDLQSVNDNVKDANPTEPDELQRARDVDEILDNLPDAPNLDNFSVPSDAISCSSSPC